MNNTKYRRVNNNLEIKEKEKKKPKYNSQDKIIYVDTKSLMEKLGIKITNEDIYNKKYSHIKKKLKEEKLNMTVTKNEEDKLNTKDFQSKSMKKKSKNDNNLKNKNFSPLDDKRPIKEKEKSTKNKKNVNDKIGNNENVKRKTIKKEADNPIQKKENKNMMNNKENKKFKKVSIVQESKKVRFKRNPDKDGVRKSTTIKISNNNFIDELNEDNNVNDNNDYIITEVNEIFSKTKITKLSKNGKEMSETVNDCKKQIRFKRNKCISAEKITSNTIFDFNSNRSSKKKKKHKNKSVDSKENNDSDNSDSYENEYNENEDENVYDIHETKAIIRSNKRHLTTVFPQKEENNEKINDEEKKVEQKYENNAEKIIIRSYKRHQSEMASKNEIKKNKEDNERANKKRLTEVSNIKYHNNLRLYGADYSKRISVDNPLMRDKFDHLMNHIVLKQNGGNSHFLKNYEKGPSYMNEIELNVNLKNVKKSIKISSCTKPGCSGPGIVKTNQDSYFIKENFLKNNNYLLGVCDGHGEKGEIISRYVSNKLPEYIKDLNNDNIMNIFKKINNEIYNNKNIESNMSGTTVISLILTTEKMICINLGDSRAALFKNEDGIYYCKNLSRDHKPNEPDENKRIINNNGRIKKCYDEDLKKYLGPDRVWLKNKEEPGLAMSRSIGDKIAHTVGVTDEPEFKNYDYDGTEKFIIIASDGIWEYLHGDDCIKIIRPFYEENKDVEGAALALVKEAFRKWKKKEVAIDDITAIVLFFDD